MNVFLLPNRFVSTLNDITLMSRSCSTQGFFFHSSNGNVKHIVHIVLLIELPSSWRWSSGGILGVQCLEGPQGLLQAFAEGSVSGFRSAA